MSGFPVASLKSVWVSGDAILSRFQWGLWVLESRVTSLVKNKMYKVKNIVNNIARHHTYSYTIAFF